MYRHFLRYNARICAGLGPWMLVVPVASTMLVLFALMAMTSMIRDYTPILVLELLGSLVMAFVGSSLLRPEYQYNTLETVLTRPVSFRAIVTVRMGLAGAGVLALQALLAVYLREVMDKEFDVKLALAAAVVSMALLTALAVAVSAAWRSPTLGFIAAGAFWALDVGFGGQLNPIINLAGYARSVKQLDSAFTAWWIGKAAMLVVAMLLVYVASRAGARPAGQWNLRRISRAALAVGLAVVIYIGSGAAYKVHWGISQEEALGNRSRLGLKQAFQCYGPIPVAHLFGPSFARFIAYRAPWTSLPTDPDNFVADGRYYEQEQMKIVAFGPSNGRWTDNALFQLGGWLSSDSSETGESEQFRMGVKCLELLVADHPDSPFVPLGMEKLFHAYRTGGDPVAADAIAVALIRQHGSSVPALDVGTNFARYLVEQERHAEAVSALETLVVAVSRDDRPAVLMQLGALYRDPPISQPDKAIAAYDEVVSLCAGIAAELAPIEPKDSDVVNVLRQVGAMADQARNHLAALRGDAPAAPTAAPPQPPSRGGG